MASFGEGWLRERYNLLCYWIKKNKQFVLVIFCLLLWIFVYLAPSIFITVKPGSIGVVYKLFNEGVASVKQYNEGLHIIFPWDDVFIYDVRYQQATHTIDVLSSDGLRYDLEVTARFRLHEATIGQLHKNVGPQYVEKLLYPVLASRVRNEIAKYHAEEVYTAQRQMIEEGIRDWLKQPTSLAVDENIYLDVVDVHLRSIVLPPVIAKAIETKLVQQQEMLEYAYRIEKETKEKERKEIEAEGVRQYNNIVKDGLNDDLLKWLGIKSSFDLAQSNNAKIVIFNSTKGDYPIIFGGDSQLEGSNRHK